MTLDNYLKETFAFIEENTKDDVTIKGVAFRQSLSDDEQVGMSIICYYNQGEVNSNFSANIWDRSKALEPLKLLQNKILFALEELDIRKDVLADKTLTL